MTKLPDMDEKMGKITKELKSLNLEELRDKIKQLFLLVDKKAEQEYLETQLDSQDHAISSLTKDSTLLQKRSQEQEEVVDKTKADILQLQKDVRDSLEAQKLQIEDTKNLIIKMKIRNATDANKRSLKDELQKRSSQFDTDGGKNLTLQGSDQELIDEINQDLTQLR